MSEMHSHNGCATTYFGLNMPEMHSHKGCATTYFGPNTPEIHSHNGCATTYFGPNTHEIHSHTGCAATYFGVHMTTDCIILTCRDDTWKNVESKYKEMSARYHKCNGLEPGKAKRTTFLNEHGWLRMLIVTSPPWGCFDDGHDTKLTDIEVLVLMHTPCFYRTCLQSKRVHTNALPWC